MEDLRTKVSRQLDRYDNFWLVHGALLEEAQKLLFEVIALRLGIRVDGAELWLGVENQSPEGPSF